MLEEVIEIIDEMLEVVEMSELLMSVEDVKMLLVELLVTGTSTVLLARALDEEFQLPKGMLLNVVRLSGTLLCVTLVEALQAPCENLPPVGKVLAPAEEAQAPPYPWLLLVP